MTPLSSLEIGEKW